MHAAGEDPGLHRRPVLAGAHDVPPIDAPVKARQEPAALGFGADEPRQPRTAAERGDVVRRVAGAARHHLGRVVLQDEHRRLARHAGDLAVDELVGDEVADDEHAPAREAVDEPEQALLALGFTGQRMDGTGDQHGVMSALAQGSGLQEPSLARSFNGAESS